MQTYARLEITIAMRVVTTTHRRQFDKPTKAPQRRATRWGGSGHVPFLSPLRLRGSCVVACSHLSAVLCVISFGEKARWTLERSASAAAPTEGCFFIIVRLQTDSAWRSGWVSRPSSHLSHGRGGASYHVCLCFTHIRLVTHKHVGVLWEKILYNVGYLYGKKTTLSCTLNIEWVQ